MARPVGGVVLTQAMQKEDIKKEALQLFFFFLRMKSSVSCKGGVKMVMSVMANRQTIIRVHSHERTNFFSRRT